MPNSKQMADFVRLLTSYQRRLYAYILTLVPRPADAEEVLQETNVTLWSKSSQFQPGTNFGAWAYRVAYLEIQTFRKRTRRDRLEFSSELIELMASERAESDEFEQLRQVALEQCLEKLSLPDRDLFARRYLPGATVAEIAAELERPPKSIYRSLERIRMLLLACVQQTVALVREEGQG